MIQKLNLPSLSSSSLNVSKNPTYSFGSMNVKGMMLKAAFAFGPNFCARSMFLFKKSFLDTFLAPTKWLHLYHASSLEMSLLIFDHTHIRFHEFRRSSPWGSSFHCSLRLNERVMIS